MFKLKRLVRRNSSDRKHLTGAECKPLSVNGNFQDFPNGISRLGNRTVPNPALDWLLN